MSTDLVMTVLGLQNIFFFKLSAKECRSLKISFIIRMLPKVHQLSL